MNKWEKEARKIILEYAACKDHSDKLQYVEYLGDSGTDLAILEEVLNFAVIGAIKKGTND